MQLSSVLSIDPRDWVAQPVTTDATVLSPNVPAMADDPPHDTAVAAVIESAHAPATIAASHSVHAAIDPALMELFREEVRTHTAALNAGLLELERDSSNLSRIEPVMRAAHSLKGACRIVGIDAAVELAHVMEDGFVAAQTGQLKLPASAIDTLLKAGDVLAALANLPLPEWHRVHAGDVARLKTAVLAINRGVAPEPVSVAVHRSRRLRCRQRRRRRPSSASRRKA
jgi:two-component system, chemotaxis family, sensor histidine kinase and response regulator WspE